MPRHFLILSLVLGFLVVLTLILGQVYHYSVFAVQSGSMGKAAPLGSLVINRQEDESRYVIGSVVTFRNPETKDRVTHRIVARTVVAGKLFFTTQGDANPNGDRWRIQKEDVVGRVVYVIPLLGYISLMVRTPIGFICTALLLLVGVVVPVAWRAAVELASFKYLDRTTT